MSREWKVGDRFSVEGVITETADSDGDYKAIFDGHTIGGCVIAAEMACAKLIHPAAPEPQKLDTSKPMRLLGSDEASFTFLQRATNGMLIIKWDSGSLDVIDESEVENIPEPKIMGRREAVLLSNGDTVWATPSDFWHRYPVIGRAWVDITEGDGMEKS